MLPLAEFQSDIQLDIPSGGFILYHFVKDDGMEAENTPVGNIIRKRYYFPGRGRSSYAFFDETDQTAYLGMNGEYSGRATAAVEWDDLPAMAYASSKFGGKYTGIDLNTSFSLRLDYAVNGEYTKTTLFTLMPVNPRRASALPWGTVREADETVPVDTLLTGKSLLMLKNHAPEGWDGRALITYDMHSTGPDTWAELTLSPCKPGTSPRKGEMLCEPKSSPRKSRGACCPNDRCRGRIPAAL